MHLVSCFSPKYVYNSYIKQSMFVPCGKCPACLNTRSRNWVVRLEQESRCHKYVVFFTLTYAPDFVPTMDFDSNSSTFYDKTTGECIDVSSDIANAYSLVHNQIFYLRKRDIQLFMKRLRKRTSNLLHDSYTDEKIRYYIAGEYGPTTLRPHYHGLLFFDSDVTAEKIGDMLHQSWSIKQEDGTRKMLGYLNWSFVENTASSYVASYVNCFAHLPKILQCKSVRPFALFSKCPPLGTLLTNEKEVREIFDSCATHVTIYDSQSSKYVDVPLWRSFKDRLFPKIRGFAKFSTHERELLYSISKFYNCQEWSEFQEKLPYIIQTCPAFHQWTIKANCWESREDVGTLISDYGLRVINNLFRISRRVCCQSAVFGIKVRDYVKNIEKFYYKQEMAKLALQLTFERDFVDQYHLHQPALLGLDMEFFYNALLDKSEKYKDLLLSYGVPLSILNADEKTKVSYLYQMSPENHHSVRHFISRNKDVFEHNCKTKKKNDYLNENPHYLLQTF